MATNPLKNIPLKTFRDFLEWNGLQHIRTNGGHEIWNKAGLKRPVVLPTHVNPVEHDVARNTLKTIGITADDYIEFLKS
jgi:predicted RNA binding protein YcfA (HicA-like mRNA interferase family)